MYVLAGLLVHKEIRISPYNEIIFQGLESSLESVIKKAKQALNPSDNGDATTTDDLESLADELQKTVESVVSAGLSKSHPLVAKARVKMGTAKIAKSQSEFDQMLRPLAENSDIGRDDIDDELADAQTRMAKLRDKGRHETPEGSTLQQKITDLKHLVELRQLVVGHPLLPSCLAHLTRA